MSLASVVKAIAEVTPAVVSAAVALGRALDLLPPEVDAKVSRALELALARRRVAARAQARLNARKTKT